MKVILIEIRVVARALLGGGGVYSYIRVMPDGFLLKSVVFKLISKEISGADHEYMSIPPPPRINALATALIEICFLLSFRLVTLSPKY